MSARGGAQRERRGVARGGYLQRGQYGLRWVNMASIWLNMAVFDPKLAILDPKLAVFDPKLAEFRP